MITQQDADQQFVESLNEEFRLTLPEKIGRIEQHWARLQELQPRTQATESASSRQRKSAREERKAGGQEPDGRDALHELTTMLHTLAGSAPMFGFTDLAAVARRAEDALTSRHDPALADLMIEVLSMMSERLVERSIH